MKKSKILVFSLSLLTGLLLQHTAWAQAQSPPGSTGPNPQASPTAVPLDGGASLLLAGGVAYGLRRLRQRAGRKEVN